MEIFKSWLVERFIAHRGLHDQNNPENSLGAFQNAIDNAYNDSSLFYTEIQHFQDLLEKMDMLKTSQKMI